MDDLHQAQRLAGDTIGRATIMLLITGREFGEDINALLALSDLTSVGVPELSRKRAWDLGLLHDDPDLFYGFWGSGFNEYSQGRPHFLMEMIMKWRGRAFANTGISGPDLLAEWNEHTDPITRMNIQMTAGAVTDGNILPSPGPFFLLCNTSDASFLTGGVNRGEAYYPRGNVAIWQCAAPCSNRMWPLPLNVAFTVGADMRASPFTAPLEIHTPSTPQLRPEAAPAELELSDTGTNEQPTEAPASPGSATEGLPGSTHSPLSTARTASTMGEQQQPPATTSKVIVEALDERPRAGEYPRCDKCGGPARPAVYAGEGDKAWLHDDNGFKRLHHWIEVVTNITRKNSMHKLVILELGCAADEHMPRHFSEMLLADTFDLQATLVRVSASDATNQHNQPFTVSIAQRPLAALAAIDAQVQRRLAPLAPRADSVSSTVTRSGIRLESRDSYEL
eukprot:TRINITY_DN1709_c0_g1_i1.p1 TRINITY_DN1709_c0_g1~~TRINITY_DN1709_c0_g1_i1.p1  ORF type:complete len:484 (+),score=71.53 TRINITY_DN1709_c0_g1_i1:103-1452(+)